MRNNIIGIAVIITLLNIIFSTAQTKITSKTDSLKNEIVKISNDTNKVILIKTLAEMYLNMNSDSAVYFSEQGLELSDKLNFIRGIAACYGVKGQYYAKNTIYDSAFYYLHLSLENYKKINYSEGMVACYNNLGLCYQYTSNYSKALEYYYYSLKLNEKLKNYKMIGRSYNYIGMIYDIQGNTDKALDYYYKAERIFISEKEDYDLSFIYNNLGVVYQYTGQLDSSLKYYSKALEINKKVNDENYMAVNLGNIGNIYAMKKEFDISIEYFSLSLELSKKIDDQIGAMFNYANIGKSLIERSNYYRDKSEERQFNEFEYVRDHKDAIYFIDSALSLAKLTRSSKELINFYGDMVLAYQGLNDWKKAFQYYDSSMTLKDSIFSIENNKQIANLSAIRDNDLKQKEIENQKITRTIIVIGAIIITSILIFFLILVYKQRNKSNKLLLNILPQKIAERLKRGETPIADQFDEASVVFIDIVDFTKRSSNSDPKRVAEVLNKLYSKLDTLAKKHGLEKIKTIGDCYMAAAGIPIPDKENSIRAAAFATEAMTMLKDYDTGDGTIINFRCGLDCGPVVAGVIGENKFIYDLWGDTVNTASRMESNGVEGKIQCTERFKEKVEEIPLIPPFSKGENAAGGFTFEERGEIEIKGKGLMRTYFLESNI